MPVGRLRPMLLALGVCLPLLGGCKSPREKLFDRRAQANERLDALYARYGGGSLAKAVGRSLEEAGAEAKARANAADAADANGFLAALGNAATEADRASFEQDCVELGRGGRPVLLTERAKTFFAAPDVRDECRRIAVAREEIEELERRTGQAQ